MKILQLTYHIHECHMSRYFTSHIISASATYSACTEFKVTIDWSFDLQLTNPWLLKVTNPA